MARVPYVTRVDLTLTCSYYTAIALAQIVLKPDMEPGRVSTL
jgi:hypothetical protein